MEATLVILNPQAGSGRAARVWAKVEPLAHKTWGNLVVAITKNPQDVPHHLGRAREAGLRRVIAVGGDGTVHTIVNALVNLIHQETHESSMLFGQLPAGTGQDLARTLNIPGNLDEAVRWLARTPPKPIDIGAVQYDKESCYFLNIASVGLSGHVDKQVNRIKNRRPWTYKMASLHSILQYAPQIMRIKIDGQLWYEGQVWVAVVANGRYFGKGMAIAPQAKVNDGLFDVVVVKDASRFNLLQAFNTVYSGKHLERPEVIHTRAKHVEITTEDESFPVDLDGEYQVAQEIRFEIQPAALRMLYE